MWIRLFICQQNHLTKFFITDKTPSLMFQPCQLVFSRKNNMSEQEKAVQDEQSTMIFNIEKIYVKDLSLEVPHAPQIFLQQEAPEVDMRINTNAAKLENAFYECSLTVSVTAKLKDERVVFLNEVTQVGIFRIEGATEEDLQLLLGVAAPNMLFPYAREVVSSSVTRAGFPPVVLAPINFEAMYYQAQHNQQTQ